MQLRLDQEAAEVRRRFDAAPDMVFAAFADAALVRRWLRPAPAVLLDVLTYDFRPGGQYRFAYTNPGAPIMHVQGLFEIVERPKRIVFSWNIEPPDEHAGLKSEVQVSLTPVGARTELVIRHVRLSREGAPRRHAEGWNGALDELERLLAGDH